FLNLTGKSNLLFSKIDIREVIFMKKNMVLFLIILSMLTACSQPQNPLRPNEDTDTKPMHYVTDEKNKEREDTRDQPTREQENASQNERPELKYVDYDWEYTDPYKNEEA